MNKISEILEALRKLPEAEKNRFTALWEAEQQAEALSPEWHAEIERRIEQIDAGEDVLVSGEELSESLTEATGIEFHLP